MSEKRPTTASLGALISVALSAGCAGTPAVDGPPELNGSSWVAEDIDGRGVIDTLQSTISFENSLRVAGNAGCNRYFGSYTLAGPELEFGSLGSTMMACPEAVMDQERRFLRALEQTRVLRLDAATDLLYFSDAEGRDVLRFSRLER